MSIIVHGVEGESIQSVINAVDTSVLAIII